MDARDSTEPTHAASETVEAPRECEAAALWSAIAADRRASDERTARLRAMRLIAGEDDAA